jgi:hypothetical protein
METKINSQWYQQNLNFIFQEVNRIRQILENSISEETNQTIPETNQFETSSLNILVNRLQLSPFERDILLLCVGMEIDPYFEELCLKAHQKANKNHPTLSLALSLFPNPNWNVISANNPLQKWQLIEFTPHLTITQAPIKIDQRIFAFLLGESSTDEILKTIISPVYSEYNQQFLPSSQQNIINKITYIWQNHHHFKPYPIIQLCGWEMTSKYAIATKFCQNLELNLYILPAKLIPNTPEEISNLKQRWEREAILTNSVLLLDCDEMNETDHNKEMMISHFTETLNSLLIISSNNRRNNRYRTIISFDIAPLSTAEQKALWENYLPEFNQELNGNLSRIVSQFNLSPNAIEAACYSVKTELNNHHNFEQYLWYYCRSQARPQLEDLAQRIETKASWNDLILPERQKSILHDLAGHLRQKYKVYQEWGFAEKEKTGLGISALFSGQSGTGKTMAAGVLAKELNLDLYRIDLSSVVSKYIGETEKNLRKIFDAAETGGVILLFDEADALFGKRTEVKDSHDRHANVEISYLLQRMESYQGLAILTTNFKTSLDTAFLRRIKFVVPFPFPDEESRSEIWQRVFPPQTPLENVNFKKLGRLNIAGGNIKNIALNAAIFAAEANEPVTMKHLLKATEAEYWKLEMPLTDREIVGWV